MRKFVFRLVLLGTGIALVYALNLLTTNYILDGPKKVRLPESGHLHSSKIVRIDDQASDPSNENRVEINVGSGVYNNEPLFRQDVEEHKILHMPDNQVLQEKTEEGKSLLEKTMKLRIPYKLVHLDLKGAPPKMSYIVNELLPLIQSAGANGLLIEYEDTFPYHGSYLNRISNGAYTLDEIKWLLREATKMNFEIIPVVQTFGHMEYILKRKEFQSLREDPKYPQSICPKQNTSWSLITQLIDQIVELHPTSNYIHIGCDEVYQISQCSRCRSTDPKKIFIDHVSRVATYIKTKYKKNVIIWDDMLRKYYTNELSQTNIGALVEIMIWDYTEDVERLVPNYLFEMYSSIFPHIWAASAFKGAFGEKLYNVNMNRHALNTLSWLKTLSNYDSKIKNFRGIALTGWSRYDHFAILCELLPVAVPSLLLDLLILKHRTLTDAMKDLGVQLKCDLVSVDMPIGYCQWPGDGLYNLLQELEKLETQVTSLATKSESSGWFSRWHVLHNYTNPYRLIELYNETSAIRSMVEIKRDRIESELHNYYSKSVSTQWLNMILEPIMFKVNIILRDIQSLSKRVVW